MSLFTQKECANLPFQNGKCVLSRVDLLNEESTITVDPTAVKLLPDAMDGKGMGQEKVWIVEISGLEVEANFCLKPNTNHTST